MTHANAPSYTLAEGASGSATAALPRSEHLVQFYENDRDLCTFAADYLGQGLVAGGVVLLIVTPEHRELILEGMQAQRIALSEARAAGRLVVVDAQEMLTCLMQGELPDPGRFAELVGGLLTKVRAQHPDAPVRAYGEMVDLLWSAGKRTAALRLEEMWNELQGELPFSLLCAYIAAGFYREHTEFRGVCEAHTHVIAPPRKPLAEQRAMPAQEIASLAAEIAQRKEVERALRGSLRALHHAENELRTNQMKLLRELDQRNKLELSREATVQRTERLMRVTSAIADAVTRTQVLDAIVQDVALALGASSASLWLMREQGDAAQLARSVGLRELTRRTLEVLRLDGDLDTPAAEALATGSPVWCENAEELLTRYPRLAPLETEKLTHGSACLPITVQGKTLGVLGLTFERRPPTDHEERHFLLLVARYCGQALERLRLLDREQTARGHAELLFRMADAVIRAEHVSEVFDAALTAIQAALGAERCAILAFDPDGVMRFRAHRGLSDAYRKAVEGHSPWGRDARAPQPLWVPDVRADPTWAAYRATFDAEQIRALGFIPLVSGSRLVGKFMVYYAQPRELSCAELELAQAIANHVAVAMARFGAIAELQQTVRFNEMFTGMLGHDLRNPLGAIMTAAQLTLKRAPEDERLKKPLSRILTSGARMARMIDQLLDLTRVRVGAGIPLVPKPVDLKALLRQVIDELDDAHPHWTFFLEAGEGDSQGTWDGDRLSQVFSNLLANAVQHGNPQQDVKIRLHTDVQDQVCVEVHNAGVIPAEVLPRLFEPMAGGERPRERSQGLGLGLYITREIVRAHGGRIDVRSGNPEGTTMAVSLPRRIAAANRSKQ